VRVALFVTCIGDTVSPEAARATVLVLERLGHQVVYPREQTCCGQMHANSGYRREALELARRHVQVFGAYELVVSPSSSCVGNVRELYPELAREAGDGELERAARSPGGSASRTSGRTSPTVSPTIRPATRSA
jgi:L-lactate dehydrogenase complex protein LldE